MNSGYSRKNIYLDTEACHLVWTWKIHSSIRISGQAIRSEVKKMLANWEPELLLGELGTKLT